MRYDEINWAGLVVPTREAIWVCVECRMEPVPLTPGGIDYRMEFAAREPRIAGVPTSRKLCLRTSDYFATGNEGYLELVVKGRIIQTRSWDDFVAVYERD